MSKHVQIKIKYCDLLYISENIIGFARLFDRYDRFRLNQSLSNKVILYISKQQRQTSCKIN